MCAALPSESGDVQYIIRTVAGFLSYHCSFYKFLLVGFFVKSVIFAGSNIRRMNCNGIIIGLATFIIIGLFHPLVIKAEYHFGKRCWWAFALAGVLFSVCSVFIDNVIWASITGVTGFSSFWSIHELFEQEKRVKKGWFPANPKRRK